MGGKVWKEEEEEEGGWREGVAGADHRSICLETAPGEVLAAGRGRLALAQGCPQPCLPCQGTCGCPALPPARLEVFQSIPALEAFKDSLPMHRPGLGSPPSTTPGALGPHQTPPKMQSRAQAELGCSQHILQVPQTPTASSGCTSPAKDTHGTQAGSPRPSPECVVYFIYRDIKEIALMCGGKGETQFANKSSTGDR